MQRRKVAAGMAASDAAGSGGGHGASEKAAAAPPACSPQKGHASAVAAARVGSVAARVRGVGGGGALTVLGIDLVCARRLETKKVPFAVHESERDPTASRVKCAGALLMLVHSLQFQPAPPEPK